MQEIFRHSIHEFGKVVSTTKKMLRASQIFNIPVFVSTQSRSMFGGTCSELALDQYGGYNVTANIDKTKLSMWTPETSAALSALPSEPIDRSTTTGPQSKTRDIILLGIETQVCITQTALDLRREGYNVYVLADGVSSCNPGETRIALARLRQEGVVVTTSESWLYERLGDSMAPEVEDVSDLIRDMRTETREAVEALCKY